MADIVVGTSQKLIEKSLVINDQALAYYIYINVKLQSCKKYIDIIAKHYSAITYKLLRHNEQKHKGIALLSHLHPQFHHI